MKIGIHSFSWRQMFKDDPHLSIEEVISQSRAMGFESIEIMTGKAGSAPEHIQTEDPRKLKVLVNFAANEGIPIHCYSTYNDFGFTPNEAWRLANIEYIQKWIALAGETGVPNLRLLTGYYPQGEDPQRIQDLVRKGIEACLPWAERYGVNLAIENHSTVFLTGLEIVQLIREFGSPRLTTCPDPTNGFKFFESPESSCEEVDRMFANLKVMVPYATNSHLKIKGFHRGDQLIGWTLDRLIYLFQIYHQAGYRGPIHLESVANGDLLSPLKRAKEVLKEIWTVHCSS